MALAMVSFVWGLVLMASLVGAQSIPGPQDFPQINITSGQQLVDNLQFVFNSSLSAPTNATLLLPSGVTSLANTSWAAPAGPAIAGWAAIVGTGPYGTINQSVWDLAGKRSIVRQLAGSSRVNTTNLMMVNSCADVYIASQSMDLAILETTGQFIFGDTPVGRIRYQTNLTVLCHRQEIPFYAFWMMYLTSNLAPLKAVATPFIGSLANPTPGSIGIRDLTPTVISWYSIPKGNSLDTNVTFQAFDDPALPPQWRIPEAGGTLMTPQHCNGTVLPNSVSRLQTITTQQSRILPMYVVDNSLDFRIYLQQSLSFIQNRVSAAPPVMIAVTQNVSMPANVATLSLRAYEVILMGPWNLVPETARFVGLDLIDTAGILQLSSLARLFVTRLNLMRLVARPLGEEAPPAYPNASSLVTALPLWAFQLPSRSWGSVYIYMENVTLFLPPSDYAVLLSAALRGPAWLTGATSTAPLLALVSNWVLAPDANLSHTSQSLSFTNLAGWGWNATGLIVVPSAPLGASFVLPDIAPPAPPPSLPPLPQAETSSRHNEAVAAGVGVGVGVGGSLVIVAAIGLFMFWRLRNRPRTHWAPDAPVDPESKISSEGSKQGGFHQISLPPGTPKRSMQEAREPGSKQPGSDASSGEHPFSGHSSGQGSGGEAGGRSLATPRQAVQQVMRDLGAADADKVTLLGILGKGAGGIVYRGRWRGLDVAVKTVLFSENVGGGNVRGMLPKDRAVTEAGVCQSVNHRNVVSTYHYDIKPVQTMEQTSGVVLDMGEGELPNVSEWRLYLVQEWCNSNLKDAIVQGLLHTQLVDGRPTAAIDIVLSLLLDITQGLAYLHAKNILHGDLKPENVLLKSDFAAPSKCVAKITDFGLSATMDPLQTHISNYSSGTPFYVSPEVLHKGRVTKASDVYSFGVLAWEIYQGHPPWVRASNGTYSVHPSFPTLPPSCPPVFAALVTRCLQKEIELRPTLPELVLELAEMHAAWLEGYDSLVRPSAKQKLAAAAAAGAVLQQDPPGAPVVSPATPPQGNSAILALAGASAAQQPPQNSQPELEGTPASLLDTARSSAAHTRLATMAAHGAPLSTFLVSRTAVPPPNTSSSQGSSAQPTSMMRPPS